MKTLCFFCGTDMGEKDGNGQEEVFHSLCGGCARRLRLDERLPELLWAIADLRKRSGSEE